MRWERTREAGMDARVSDRYLLFAVMMHVS